MPSDRARNGASNRSKTVVVTLLVALLLTTATGLAVIYSGVIDIAATKPHCALTSWVLQTTMEHSVRAR